MLQVFMYILKEKGFTQIYHHNLYNLFRNIGAERGWVEMRMRSDEMRCDCSEKNLRQKVEYGRGWLMHFVICLWKKRINECENGVMKM